MPTYRISPHVHYRTVDDEVVILDARTESYLGLNPTGAMIWNNIVGGQSVEKIAEILLAGFFVTEEQAAADADQFVKELLKQGLIEESKQ